MAYDFRPDSTPVLRYSPREHQKADSRRDLLWPAYVYRVMAPEVRQRQVNVFQKAILGMCLGGNTDPVDIARLLCIDPDLVLLILDELQSLKLLDHDLRVTADGQNRLVLERNDLPDPHSLTVGYVFQDPWSSRLWPRFVEALEYADLHFSEGERYPRLRIGSPGNPRYLRPFVKFPNEGQEPRVPSPRDILDAVWRHRQSLRSGRSQVALDTEDADLPAPAVMTPLHLDRVTAISEEPQCFFLSTYLYLFPDELGVQDWHVCDPFGLGASSFLRRVIVQQTEKDGNLRSWVESIIGPGLAQTRSESTRFLESLVGERLGEGIRFPSLVERLVALERACLGIAKARCPQDRLEQVILEAAKTLERLFACLLEVYPPNGSWQVFMTADRAYREELVNTIAGDLGFSTPIPMNICRVRASGVRWAAEGGGGTLGQRIVAVLLSARLHDDHPLCRAAGQSPGLLQDLGELINLRDRSAHDVMANLERTQVQRQVEVTYEVARLLAGLALSRKG